MSSFQDLITKIRSKSSTNLIICGIIPRPCDMKVDPEEPRMKKVNKRHTLPFLHTYMIFLHKNKPIRSLYAVNDDGIHLNFEGTRRLRCLRCRVLLSCLSRFFFRLAPFGSVQLILRVPGDYISSTGECWVVGQESWRPLRDSPVSCFGRSGMETR